MNLESECINLACKGAKTKADRKKKSAQSYFSSETPCGLKENIFFVEIILEYVEDVIDPFFI